MAYLGKLTAALSLALSALACSSPAAEPWVIRDATSLGKGWQTALPPAVTALSHFPFEGGSNLT